MKKVFFFAAFSILLSCSEDDNGYSNYAYVVFDDSKLIGTQSYFGNEIYGYPYLSDGDTLGFFKIRQNGKSDPVTNKFESILTDEYPVGAFELDKNTGCLRVKNAALLDFKQATGVSFTISTEKLNKTLKKNLQIIPLTPEIVIRLENKNFQNFKDLRNTNLQNGDAIDTVKIKSLFGSKGELNIKLIQPDDAVSMEQETGIIRVKNVQRFDPGTFNMVAFTFEVSVEHNPSQKIWTELIYLNYGLNDFNPELCGSSSKPSLYGLDYIADSYKVIPFQNKEGIDLEVKNNIKATRVEYTFIPNKDLQLCRAGEFVNLESERSCQFKLLDSQGTVLMQAKGTNDDGWWYDPESFVSLSHILQANKKYTIINERYSYEVTYYLENPNVTTPGFPIHFEEITITDAKFFLNDTELAVPGIPMINLTFVK